MSWTSALRRTRVAKACREAAWSRPTFPLADVDWARLVVVDFETYFDVDYTLRKMSTSEYVRDPRFKAQMVGIKIGNKPTKVYPPREVKSALQKINWTTHSLLCHNTQFDGFIMSHHYGIVPHKYYDTLSMARGLHSNEIGASLDEVAHYYGRGSKIEGVLELTKGVLNWPAELYMRAAGYCAQDVDLTYDIFRDMHAKFPADEMDLVDLTIRMFCDPVLKVDLPRVEKELANELAERHRLFHAAVNPRTWEADEAVLKTILKTRAERALTGDERDTLIIKRVLGNNERFANLLRAEGVDVPIKISKAWMKLGKEEKIARADEKYAYAFAKDDLDFVNMPDRIDEWRGALDPEKKADVPKIAAKQDRLRDLINARLAVKSTTNITRAQRFLTAGANGMSLPCGYAYARAHCLLGDAEVLTPTGWARLDEWTGGDIVQWEPTGSMRFMAATANEFKIDEQIIIANSRYHTAAYTLGHNIPGFTSTGSFKPRLAGNAADGRFQLPLCGEADGHADISGLDAQIAVMVQADGNIRTNVSNGRCVRFGFRKQRKIERCVALLDDAKVPFTAHIDSEGSTRITVGAASMHLVLKLIDENTKQFLPVLLDAPLDVKRTFIDELKHWDGCKNNVSESTVYGTKNQHNAEFVQTMAHLCSRSALVTRTPRGKWADSFSVFIRSDKTTRSEPKHYSVRKHKGKVYCPSTETGYFLMRQNGRIVVTGNTLRWGGNNKMNMQNLTRGGELRLSILAPPGHKLAVVDSGQIEARVNGWLWGQDDLMEAFRDADAGVGRDAYCRFADNVYGRTITKADSMERFVGKVCVAEGELVLTDRGLVPINLISKKDRLWDGVEWVTHDGVIDQGIKEVITYDGLTATPDHEVFTEDGRIVSLGQAASEMARLQRTGAEGQSIRFCDDHVIADTPRKRLSVRVGKVQSFRGDQTDLPQQPEERQNDLFPQKRAQTSSPRRSFGAEIRRYLRTMHQPFTQALGKLRRTRDQVFVQNSDGVHSVGIGKFTPQGLRRGRDRSYEQQRQLRAREYTACDTARKHAEPPLHGKDNVAGQSLDSRRFSEPVQQNLDLQTGGAAKDDWRGNLRQVRVFDIVNAGPRLRYTVSNKLVFNCVLGLGFQMGAPKFQMTLAKGALGGPPVHFELSKCQQIVSTYRSKNYQIENGWKICKRIIEDMAEGIEGSHGPISWGFETIYLPNGLTLKYPGLRKTKNEESGWDEWSYQSGDMRSKIYGGLLCENIVQCLARLIVGWQMLQISRKYRVVMTTHDEVVCCVKSAQAPAAFKFMHKWMSTAPAWCSDIPLNCEGGFDVNYSK